MKKYTFIIAALFIIILTGCAAPENLSMSKDVPVDVNSGDIFEFTISVNNDDLEKHELRSIDISDSFLDGIFIIKTNPETKEEYDAFGQHIFEFKTDLPKTSETQVIFTAKAIKPGDFSGDLDVCIDGDASCLYNSIRMIVN